MKKAVIFDMDGTLIECGKYYEATNVRGAAYLAEHTGLPQAACLALLAQTDLAACALPNAFKADRYPRSFAAAAMAACHIAAEQRPQLVPYGTHMHAMADIGRSVFEAEYAEFPGVKPVLAQLRAEGWYLLLFTKGDNEVQRGKIFKHGYQHCFNQCVITLEKSPAHVAKLLRDFDIDPAQSVYVGDSMRDDILPAQASGLKTVLMTAEPAWAYDTGAGEPHATIRSAVEVPGLLHAWFGGEASPG